MKTIVDDRLREEARHFGLAFSCENCAHFVVESGGCAHEYPNRAHRASELSGAESLVFCKEFELT